MKKILVINILFILSSSIVYSQSTRGLVNDGVDEYEESNFPEAEAKFKEGIENDVENFESRFNLGDAIYKQGRFDEAFEEFKNSFPLAKTDQDRAMIYHNLGNSLLKNQKLKESIGAYREALKLNPDDMETKYNLSYALKQMQDQQNNQQNQDQQNQDQNQDQQNQDQENQDQQNQDQENQDQQNDENKEQEENKDQQDQQNEDKQQDQQNQDQQQQQPQEPKDEISKDEAQRILDALKNNEAELQKKMREQKTKATNVEKDW